MKDYRVPVAFAVPLAIGFLGILWLLRRKSGPGDKKSKPKERDALSEKEDTTQAQHRAQQVNKEGITITQRKIPETQARDRGSDDLNLNIIHAPDTLAGDEKLEADVYTSNLSVDLSKSPASHKISAADKKVHITKISSSHAGQGDSLTSIQQVQVDKLLTSAMGDGLNEAKAKLSSYKGPSRPHAIRDMGKVASDASSEISKGSPEVEEKASKSSIGSLSQEKPPKIGRLDASASAAPYSQHQEDISGDKPESVEVSGDSGFRSLEKIPVEGAADTLTSVVEGTDETSLSLSSSVMDTSSAAASVVPKPCDERKPQQQPDLSTDLTAASPLHDQNAQKRKNTSTVEPDLVHSSPAKTVLRTPSESSDLPESQGKENIQNVSSHSNKRHACERYGAKSSPTPEVGPVYPFPPPADADGPSSRGEKPVESNWGMEVTDGCSDKNAVSKSDSVVVDKATSVSGSGADEPVLAEGGSKRSSESEGIVENADPKEGSPAKPQSPVCDSNSEGSNDSGRGGSEHDTLAQNGENLVHFDFNMPSELCGRFIGRQGKNINYLKSKTGAHVSLTNNPFSPDFQICQIVGTQVEVDDALAMIRRKFPLKDFPMLTMQPLNMAPTPTEIAPVIVPEVMQLSLPEGVSVEVYVCSIVNANHVFVQQPTHRSFMSLEKLSYFLNTVYGSDPNVPCVPTPVECGVICVCESNGCWYRAMIMMPENEAGETQVKFVDYGGYEIMHVSALKQIRTDFMSLPFQAVECFMANITPNQGETTFSEEATLELSEMTSGKLLQCQVVARAENSIPYIHLYQINPETSSAVMINRALVNSQRVRWIEIL